MATYPKASIELGSRSPEDSSTLLSSEVSGALPWQKRTRRGASKLKHALLSYAGLTLIFTLIAWLAAYVYCKHAYWRDPGSYFYRKKGVFDLKYSAQRQDVAWDFIETWNKTTEQVKEETDPVICVGMVTVKRSKGMDYLNGTIGSMLGTLTEDERSALSVQLLFADLEPSRHPEWQQPWLNSIDYWSQYELPDQKLEEIRGWPNLQTKGIFDYVYMIDQCLNRTNAAYIAVFEDDLIFAEGWLSKTIGALQRLREMSVNWLYLRLFYVDKPNMFGYDRARDHWFQKPRNTLYISVGVSVAGAPSLVTLLIRYLWRRRSPSSDTYTLLVLGLITVPLFLFLLYLIGHNSLYPTRGLQRMDTKGCCTQALIYPRRQAANVADMLRPKTKGQTDLEIEKWATAEDYARFAVVPQVVQHIGTISSRGLPKDLAKTTWAYLFEGFNSEKLRKAHLKLAKWGIWRARGDAPA